MNRQPLAGPIGWLCVAFFPLCLLGIVVGAASLAFAAGWDLVNGDGDELLALEDEGEAS